MLPVDRSQISAYALSEEETVQLRLHHTLEALVRAGMSVLDVVVQDEFSHDVIVRAGAHFAVYAST